MSQRVYPHTELVEIQQGPDWITLILREPISEKRYDLTLAFRELTGTVNIFCQVLGYGRSYVERPDGKVRLMLATRDLEAEKDFVILADPEKANQLLKMFRKHFKNMRRRIRYAAKKPEAAAFFPFMLQAA